MELTFRPRQRSPSCIKRSATYRALLEKRQTLEQERKRLNKARYRQLPSTQQEVLRLSRDVEARAVRYICNCQPPAGVEYFEIQCHW